MVLVEVRTHQLFHKDDVHCFVRTSVVVRFVGRYMGPLVRMFQVAPRPTRLLIRK